KEELTGVGDTLEDKAISVKISLSDKSGETYYKDITYQLVKENDGSGDVFRIMAAYELEDYWQETENTHPGFWAWRNR
ncbi:MAG: hypothetical protein IJL27_02870, partial [Firmicutes bacterium]|nr:hypothetical protein [Bacillota bacterium]